MAGAENGEDPRAVTVVQVAAGEAHTLALTGIMLSEFGVARTGLNSPHWQVLIEC